MCPFNIISLIVLLMLGNDLTANHSFGFYCKEHVDSSIEGHPATGEVSHTVYSLDGNLTAVLSPQQQIWFDKYCE